MKDYRENPSLFNTISLAISTISLLPVLPNVAGYVTRGVKTADKISDANKAVKIADKATEGIKAADKAAEVTQEVKYVASKTLDDGKKVFLDEKGLKHLEESHGLGTELDQYAKAFGDKFKNRDKLIKAIFGVNP